MIAFPNAKINLGLHILNRRPDGFHNIESVLFPIGLSDGLELIEAPDGNFAFTSSGLQIPSNGLPNLCEQAFWLMHHEFRIPKVHLHLHKVIPAGSGLGGGSADAAFSLKMFNEKFSLGLSHSDLELLAAKLGSDCPFFIRNEPMLAKGRGEILQPISLSLKGLHLMLIRPGLHISTAEAFAGVKPAQPARTVAEILAQPPHTWKKELKNDFEESLFSTHPLLGEIKTKLYSQGAIYAAMSGSGSAIFGLFEKKPAENLKQAFHDSFIWHEELN
ncbi:MAG: 4-(cytidine 5'-diphospho)-2-C-methyl-D-erythritol kinase [Bacteroidales bacterium]|nr:4-(cytidine 5'-diphospho)-2-C-methyl-D-erythritol kinase [Bacteroidales bacterium]